MGWANWLIRNWFVIHELFPSTHLLIRQQTVTNSMALLSGLLICKRCRKLVKRGYTGNTHTHVCVCLCRFNPCTVNWKIVKSFTFARHDLPAQSQSVCLFMVVSSQAFLDVGKRWLLLRSLHQMDLWFMYVYVCLCMLMYVSGCPSVQVSCLETPCPGGVWGQLKWALERPGDEVQVIDAWCATLSIHQNKMQLTNPNAVT